MPYVVTLSAPSLLSRSDFGIGPDRFVFLSIFDMRSVFERKNPLAIIAAFIRAFRPEDNCELVIKINHAEAAPSKIELLRAAAAGKPIRVLCDTFPHSDVVALMEASDCIVSLHRAEGFGFVMAEAMLLGKPVIATGYSGNVDFTLPSNSFLVGYTLCPVGPGCEPYDPEALWADPSQEDAVAQMQLVYRNEALRRERSAAGRRFIQQHYSAEAIGARYRERCDWIADRYGLARVVSPELEVAL
jgi:glycosyltransferase involved in cell wall biosynthesis